jgi:hypothetical protein
MKVQVRIPLALYEAARADLARPHPFAAERVGFFSTALGLSEGKHAFVLLTRYIPIPDEQYVNDPGAGARIGAAAIRTAIQRVLDEDSGQLHVHVHEHYGPPRPSLMDSRETPRLIESLAAAGPGSAHGAIILSQDGAWARIWLPGLARPLAASRISVVGAPLRFLS